MTTSLSVRLMVSAVACALALAACNRSEPAETPADTGSTAAPAASAEPATAPAAPEVREYPADYAIDAALARKDVGASMELVGAPVYLVESDSLEFVVNIANTGRTAIVGKGKMPVNLAVTLAGPDGVDEAPGVRNFQRRPLPLIPEGGSGEVKVRVPAKPLEGLAVRLELVQEGVVWWSKWKQPTLDVGTFKRCTDPNNGLCTEEGAPLAKR